MHLTVIQDRELIEDIGSAVNDMVLKVLGRKMEKEVSIPVLLTGGVNKPEEAEQLLREGKADLIGIGRALMKNAEWGSD